MSTAKIAALTTAAMLPLTILLLVALWTGEDRWAGTAAILGVSLMIIAASVLVTIETRRR